MHIVRELSVRKLTMIDAIQVFYKTLGAHKIVKIEYDSILNQFLDSPCEVYKITYIHVFTEEMGSVIVKGDARNYEQNN